MPDQALSLSNKQFQSAIAIASMAVERRNTLPILGMVRCRANGSFEASGTDLDVMVTAKVDHGGGPKVEFMLPEATTLAKAVKLGGGDAVNLDTRGEKVALSSGRLSMAIAKSRHADDFPSQAGDMASESFTATLSHSQLRSLGRIASAVSTEETRYYLNGIYIHHISGFTYRAAATDGHRLCTIDLELADAAGALSGIILPRKALRLLLSLAGSGSPKDSGVRLTVGTTNTPNRENSTAPERGGVVNRARWQIAAGTTEVTLSTKLIDGTFPDYSRVIPKGEGKALSFDRLELRRAVEAVSQGIARVRTVRITLTEDGATIAAQYTAEGYDTAVTVACKHRCTGFFFGFNGGYLLSMLDAAGGEEIVINTEDAAAPALIKNTADTAWTGVLMPMRI